MSAHERRSRNKLTEDEDASQLKLGPDFAGLSGFPLSISHVKAVLDDRDNSRSMDNAVFKKTLDYVNTFSRFEHTENLLQSADAVRDAFSRDPPLSPFEVAQLANLCPLEAEEAKTLIPSLKFADTNQKEEKISDDDLQTMLGNAAALRSFS